MNPLNNFQNAHLGEQGAPAAPIPPAATPSRGDVAAEPDGCGRVILGPVAGYCTLGGIVPVDRFRVFLVIPGFFLEGRFPACRLPCAEGSALHMGGFHRR